MWVNTENITVGEGSQAQKAARLLELFRIVKSIETAGSFVFAGGWWQEGIECDCKLYRVSFGVVLLVRIP